MKRAFAAMLCVALLCTVLFSCSENSGDKDTESMYTGGAETESFSAEEAEDSDSETDYVAIEVENFGTIIAKLYPSAAPKTVMNFKSLVKSKFYDGLTFHRVYKGFVIQCGDPTGTGTGGSGITVFGEFQMNGFYNNISHERGVLSMARKINDCNSATSQFFICHSTEACSSLDKEYAAFGRVLDGMDVVDAICEVKVDANTKRPDTPVVIKSIRFVKKASE